MLRFIIVALLIAPKSMVACTVTCSLDTKGLFKDAELVIHGRVSDITVSGDEKISTVRVIEQFKGRAVEKALLYTKAHDPCGPPLTPSRNQILFPVRDANVRLTVGYCGALEAEVSALKVIRRRAWWWRSRLSSWLPL